MATNRSRRCLGSQDASSPEGASQFDLQLWDATSNNQLAAALASASGCATTPVVDPCQQSGGPADVQVRVRCANPPGRPCRVRVAAYASACPDGPPPQVAVVTDGGGGSSGGVGGGSTAAVDSSRPDQMTAQPPSSSSAVTSDGSSSGVSPTVWVVAGVSVGAALLIGVWVLGNSARRGLQRRSMLCSCPHVLTHRPMRCLTPRSAANLAVLPLPPAATPGSRPGGRHAQAARQAAAAAAAAAAAVPSQQQRRPRLGGAAAATPAAGARSACLGGLAASAGWGERTARSSGRG